MIKQTRREKAKESFLNTLEKGPKIWLNNLYMDRQKVKEVLNKVQQEYSQWESQDWQDPNKIEWSAQHWIDRIQELLEEIKE